MDERSASPFPDRNRHPSGCQTLLISPCIDLKRELDHAYLRLPVPILQSPVHGDAQDQ